MKTVKHAVLLLLLTILATRYCLAGEGYFLSNPSLSPDGKTVVFSYAGDLWQVPEKGGTALRLTSMPGQETEAHFSPDGKWIAFTGQASGNADIYVMSLASAHIRQLTFHSSDDQVSSWAWDSRFIYFSSQRTGQISGYKVDRAGGTPVRVLGEYYFQNDHNLFEHPLSGDIFFNDTWESSNQIYRKRYKGPFNPDIQSYNITTKRYRRYTHYEGKDFGATIDSKGNIYFISDEINGEFNLYTFENGRKKALTRFETSIKTPNVNAQGGRVVFEKDYQLFCFEVRTGTSRKISVSLPANITALSDREFDIAGNITGMDVSPDGTRLAFSSRGELFVSNADGRAIRKVTNKPTERILEVKWLSDGQTLLFNQTQNGYLNWNIISTDDGQIRAITNDLRNNRSLSFNQDKTLAVYLSGIDEVRVLDLKTWASKTLIKDEIWAMFADKTDPRFSPDGRYVCYTAHRDSEEDIFVCELASGATVNLTRTGVTETGPLWSPDGKYLYFTASRLNAAFPTGMQDAGIYRLPLENLSAPFRSAQTSRDATAEPTIVIDTSRIMERIEHVGHYFGSNYLSDLVQIDSVTCAFFISNQDQGKWAIWKTSITPLLVGKNEKITGGPEGSNVSLRLVCGGGSYFALSSGNVYRLLPQQNRLEAVPLRFAFKKRTTYEFSQMFFDAWAKVEENYYDETFHGTDWKAVRNKYSHYLPFIHTCSDFQTLMNDMLGELNSSHQRFNLSGTEPLSQAPAFTLETGILFRKDAPFVVDRVLQGTAADKKDIALLPGDELIRVDSMDVDRNIDRDFYFTRKTYVDEIQLAFRRGQKRFEVMIHAQRSLSGHLHDEWTQKNRNRVTQASNGKIAYACMKNMERPEFDRFLIQMSQGLQGKAGLILDLRYNDGGQMHDELLRFLSQRSYAQWKYRGGKSARQSHFAPSDKPIVLLINQQTLSDGEMTAAGFKSLGLGKVIGSETYHWEIFTRPFYMVDGSSVRVSAWGCYTLDGSDLELTGVEPDIKVYNTFEDNIAGRDPQLDRALRELLTGPDR